MKRNQDLDLFWGRILEFESLFFFCNKCLVEKNKSMAKDQIQVFFFFFVFFFLTLEKLVLQKVERKISVNEKLYTEPRWHLWGLSSNNKTTFSDIKGCRKNATCIIPRTIPLPSNCWNFKICSSFLRNNQSGKLKMNCL